MAKGFYLSLLEDYATHWKTDFALRELLQNLIDGAIQSGGSFLPRETSTGYELVKNDSSKEMAAKIEYYQDRKSGTLRLLNHGIVLPKSALLMGGTSKANSKVQCGKFGEGIKQG